MNSKLKLSRHPSAMDSMTHAGDDLEPLDDNLTKSQAWCLFFSHFLSMWNSRMYEYGAVGYPIALQSNLRLLTD